MKKTIIVLLFVSIMFLITSCTSNEKDELFIVPHSISNKVYSYETSVTLAFVSNKEITSIDDFSINIFYHLFSAVYGYELDTFSELDNYNSYYIYLLVFKIFGIEGGIEVNRVQFSISDTEYFFDTNIYLTDDITKEIHFYSGTDSADIIWPSYINYGLDFLLRTSQDITIKNIEFEENFDFNINEYINDIKLNELPFDNDFNLLKDEVFSLSITFNESTPENTFLISQIIINYLDSHNEEKSAYVLVPLYLGSYELIAKRMIDEID
jgi:hypothetical protein